MLAREKIEVYFQQCFRFIVVETNYRIYAYTDSHLQIALLGLFTEVLYRFPNLCVGIISRDSCRQAFR